MTKIAYGSFYASLALFFMHFVGLAVAVPTAFVLNKFILRTRPQPFLLELPAYRVPRLRDVAWRMFQSGAEFTKRAGTIIFAITIIVWALLYFPRPAMVEETIRQTYLKNQALLHNTGLETIRAGAGGLRLPTVQAARLLDRQRLSGTKLHGPHWQNHTACF